MSTSDAISGRRLRMLGMLAIASAAAQMQCSQPDASGDAFVIAREDGRHQLVRRRVELDSITRLQSAEFVTLYRPSVLDNAEDDTVVVGGELPALQLVEKDGAWLPTLYEHLVALSALHHLIATRRYFQSIGGARLGGLPRYQVAVYPMLEVGSADNAFFGSNREGGVFGIMPDLIFREVPLAAHEGVITHESAHAIFWYLRPDLREGRGDFSQQALNEAVADIHAAARLDSPRFLDDVFPDDVAAARRLDTVRVLDASQLDQISNKYTLGSFITSAFWSFRMRLLARRSPADASRRMGVLAFEATATMKAVRLTTIGSFLEAAVAAASAEDKSDFCAVARAQLAPFITDATGCGP